MFKLGLNANKLVFLYKYFNIIQIYTRQNASKTINSIVTKQLSRMGNFVPCSVISAKKRKLIIRRGYPFQGQTFSPGNNLQKLLAAITVSQTTMEINIPWFTPTNKNLPYNSIFYLILMDINNTVCELIDQPNYYMANKFGYLQEII